MKSKELKHLTRFSEESVFLSITSWVGSCAIGARHYYGRLSEPRKTGQSWNYSRKELNVTRHLSAKDAVKLNDEEREREKWDGIAQKYPTIYEVGESSERFYNKQDVIDAALVIWRQEFPGYKFLVMGNYAAADPQYILDGDDKKLVTASRKIYDQFVKNDYWEIDENRAQKICDKWDKLFLNFSRKIN